MSTTIQTKGRHWRQVQSLRDITKTNFPNGQIRYNWSIPSNECWNPSLSFFTLRYQLELATGTFSATASSVGSGAVAPNAANIPAAASAANGTLSTNPGLIAAPNMFFNDTHWQQMEMRVNGVCVNKQDNYCQQIAALKQRSCPENKNKMLNKMNFASPYWEERARVFNNLTTINKKRNNSIIDVSEFAINSDSKISATRQGDANNDPLDIDLAGCKSLLQFKTAAEYIAQYRIRLHSDSGRLVEGPITVITSTKITMGIAGEAGAGFTATMNSAEIPLVGGFAFLIPIREDAEYTDKFQVATRGKEFETIWKPCLGFFDQNVWLPGGDYELILTPFPQSQLDVLRLETIIDLHRFKKGAADDRTLGATVEMNNMELNLCVCEGKSTVNTLEFTEIRCQAKTINIQSLTQKQFNIHRKCHALTVAYQDNRVMSNNSFSSTKFKIYPERGSNKSKYHEARLTRFYIQYDGSVLPNPIPNIRFDPINEQHYLYQRYYETMKYKIMQYDNIETFEEWLERGPYYQFQWPRKNMNAVEVQVSQEFSSTNSWNTSYTKPQLLLFEHYNVKYNMDVYNNYVTGVKHSTS